MEFMDFIFIPFVLTGCLWLLLVAPVYLAMTFYRPTWTDWFEFAVITALWPLSINCDFVPYLALAMMILLTLWNIVIYKKLKKRSRPCTKAWLRIFIVPALFIATALFCLWAAAVASC